MPKTVLLADDSTTIQRVVELTFADQDITVVSVGDTSQAIEAISRSAPDLVLADIGMPGRSGYEVVEFVRSQPRFASLPVLLLAGAFEPVDQAQAHLAGADGVLTKPFDPAVLIGRVNELLATGRGGPTVGQPPPAILRETPTVPEPAMKAVDGPGTRAPEQVDVAVPSAPADAEPDLPLSPTPSAAASRDADLYFERIDQAFATLSKTPRPPLPDADEDSRVDEEDVALPTSSPVAATEPLPLTDAFAALLDAERTGTIDPRLRSAAASPVPPAPPAVDIEALADRVARRVLDQLTDRVVHETVADIVSSTAERLVREEIERIKRNIK